MSFDAVLNSQLANMRKALEDRLTGIDGRLRGDVMEVLSELLVLSRAGATMPLLALPAFGAGRFQTFSSSGNFTVPAGVTRVRVQVIGGGGAGGKSCKKTYSMTADAVGGGGAGGGYAYKVVDVAPGQQIPVVIGAGGSGYADSDLASYSLYRGKSGGTTSFGAFVSATGGSGGRGYYYFYSTYNGSTDYRNDTATLVGGIGIDGDVNYRGGSGAIEPVQKFCCGGAAATHLGDALGMLPLAGFGSGGNPEYGGRGIGCGGGGSTYETTSLPGSGVQGLCIVEW